MRGVKPNIGATMEGIAGLINAIANLLWPLIMLVLIAQFTPAIRGIIESARSRRFTLKVGGQELTVDEVNQQQRNLISDLQLQVLALREAVGTTLEASTTSTAAPVKLPHVEHNTVLWVDDRPKNNSYFVQELNDRGIFVDLALTTSEGLQRLEQGKYRLVISDMQREEGGSYNPVAGLDLLRKMHSAGIEVPVIIYCSTEASDNYRQEALKAGAKAITTSGTELAGLINGEIAGWKG
jgi:CheY-like chemotaxis protein